MKIYNSKRILFYILIILLSLIFVGLVGAIIRLINIPAVLITLLLIGGLSYSKKLDWLQNSLQSIFKIKSDKKLIDLSLITKKQAAGKSLESIDQLIRLINDKSINFFSLLILNIDCRLFCNQSILFE